MLLLVAVCTDLQDVKDTALNRIAVAVSDANVDFLIVVNDLIVDIFET